MDTAITSAVTTETANAFADLIGALCEPTPPPVAAPARTVDAAAIARTTLQQLGGSRFVAMTGAKHLTHDDAGALAFRIGTGAKDKINHVTIELAADDTYTVTFRRIRGVDCKIIGMVEGVYCDALRRVFTEYTGFDCTL